MKYLNQYHLNPLVDGHKQYLVEIDKNHSEITWADSYEEALDKIHYAISQCERVAPDMGIWGVQQIGGN